MTSLPCPEKYTGWGGATFPVCRGATRCRHDTSPRDQRGSNDLTRWFRSQTLVFHASVGWLSTLHSLRILRNIFGYYFTRFSMLRLLIDLTELIDALRSLSLGLSKVSVSLVISNIDKFHRVSFFRTSLNSF